MNVMTVIFALLCLILPLSTEAETILLKNGTLINAKILEKDRQKIKADVNGVSLTYYVDDLRSIDGIDPAEFLAPPPNKSPVVQPQSQAGSQITSKANPSSKFSGMSKKELILKFIDVFGTRASLRKNFADLLKNAPPKQAQDIQNALNVDELIDQLVPLYDKYFTEQELEAYINFYSSPAGQKLLSTVPTVMGESVGVSLKYFKTKLPSMPTKAVE